MAKPKVKLTLELVIIALVLAVIAYFALTGSGEFSLVPSPTTPQLEGDDTILLEEEFVPEESAEDLDATCTFICGPQMVEGGNIPYDYRRYNADGVCVEPNDLLTVHALETGVCCCGNFISPPPEGGADEGGGAESVGFPACDAFRISEDKPYYTLINPIPAEGTLVDVCADHAWNHCDLIGSSLKNFDFTGNDCCAWRCN